MTDNIGVDQTLPDGAQMFPFGLRRALFDDPAAALSNQQKGLAR